MRTGKGKFMLYRKTFGIFIVILMMPSVCSAEEPSESTDKPTNGPVAKTESGGEANHRLDESEPDSVIIPLDQIWAFDMPGTKNVRDLEPAIPFGLPNKEYLHRSPINQIQRSLSNSRFWPKKGNQAGPGFVVEGIDKEALKNAHVVLIKKDKSDHERIFPPDTDLSIVFYSFLCGAYVRLVDVERGDNLVTVRYRLISHATANSTSHFTIIPIGKLSEGHIQVNIVQAPPMDEHGNNLKRFRLPRGVVCNSFSFVVQK